MESTRTEIDLETLLSRAEWVHRLARKLVVDEARADELVAEVWLAALGARGPRSSLEGWVRSVLDNAVRTMCRGDRNRRARERSAARSEAVPSSAAILERSEQMALGF